MGLFRILYSLFYLWYLSVHFAARQGNLPAMHRFPILAIRPFPAELPGLFFQGLESFLVTALVLLLVGYWVRWSTTIVLVLGGVLEAFYVSTDAEHSTIFLAFYIPFFVLVGGGRWRYQTLLFEGLFFLALLGPRLRDFMVALALTFHAVNALWIVVTFTPVMVVYGMFIDWHQLWQRIGWRWLPPQMYRLTQYIDQIPESGLVAGLFGVAILTGFSWNTDLGLRPVFNWGGLLDWRTIWWPVLPIALIWLGCATIRLISVLLTPLSTRLGR
jgi:hypothetical protein